MLTAEQLQQRMSGIGGSDAGTALGLNKYKTPLQLYLEKIGEAEPDDLSDNQRVHFGNVLEDTVAKEYARRTGKNVRKRNQMFRHKEHDFMLANIDRSVDGEQKILECKTADAWTLIHNAWGPDGSDEVPDHYLVQVYHYMIVMGYKLADLAVLIGGNDFRIYHFEYEQDLADAIIEQEYNFWHNHVLTGIPPEPITEDDLELLYTTDNTEPLVATDDILAMHQSLKVIKDEYKKLEGAKDGLEFMLKKFMKDHTTLLGPDEKPLTTWKRAKASKRFNKEKFEQEHGDLYKSYLEKQAGSRRFLVK